MRDVTDPGIFRLSCGTERDTSITAPALPLHKCNSGQSPEHGETEQTRNRQIPTYTLALSQLLRYEHVGTNPHTTRAQFWWQPVPKPSLAWHRSASTRLPPNCIQAAAYWAVCWYPKRGRLVQKVGGCPSTGPYWKVLVQASSCPYLPDSKRLSLAGSTRLEEVALAGHPLRGQQEAFLNSQRRFHHL